MGRKKGLASGLGEGQIAEVIQRQEYELYLAIEDIDPFRRPSEAAKQAAQQGAREGQLLLLAPHADPEALLLGDVVLLQGPLGYPSGQGQSAPAGRRNPRIARSQLGSDRGGVGHLAPVRVGAIHLSILNS
jgi:hypothetical protein